MYYTFISTSKTPSIKNVVNTFDQSQREEVQEVSVSGKEGFIVNELS